MLNIAIYSVNFQTVQAMHPRLENTTLLQPLRLGDAELA